MRLPGRRDFRLGLGARTPAIIAEIKKASPSKGLLAADFAPARIAAAYQAGGAAALSVLTDQRFFQGSLADLELARAAVEVPVLRKDFTIAPEHILEAAAHGADAILLIVAILDAAQLRAYRELAAEFGMAALVEVHDRAELGIALKSGAEIIGVNNRNLKSLKVDLNNCLGLIPMIPKGIVIVAESGLKTHEDIRKVQEAGAHAVLIGEVFMRSPDIGTKIKEVMYGTR